MLVSLCCVQRPGQSACERIKSVSECFLSVFSLLVLLLLLLYQLLSPSFWWFRSAVIFSILFQASFHHHHHHHNCSRITSDKLLHW